jgi:WD40 repeat protein
MRFSRFDSPVRAVVWSADGLHLLAGTSDGRVRRQDVDTLEGKVLESSLGTRLHTLLLSPDGKHMLLGGACGKLLFAKASP